MAGQQGHVQPRRNGGSIGQPGAENAALHVLAGRRGAGVRGVVRAVVGVRGVSGGGLARAAPGLDGAIALGFVIAQRAMGKAHPPFSGLAGGRCGDARRQVPALGALGVVAFHVGLHHGEPHTLAVGLAAGLAVGIAGKALTALGVVAALGGPVEEGVAAVVGHGVGAGPAAPGAGHEIAVVVVACKEGVERVVDARLLVFGGRAGQLGQGGVDLRRQAIGEKALNLGTAVVQHPVDAKVQVRSVHLQDVVSQQAEEAIAGSAHFRFRGARRH